MSEFKFGDIISFKPQSILGFRFQHFGIYVGDVEMCDKKPEEVIYHTIKWKPVYEFYELTARDKVVVNNYLDDYTDPLTGTKYCKGDDEEILQRIIETYETRDTYGTVRNNCEHLATYVRYGVRISMQLHMTGEKLVISQEKFDKKLLRKYLKKKSKCLPHPDCNKRFCRHPQHVLSPGNVLLKAIKPS